jgi:1-acyl-sn-glycerol-3-phosphate acyltransferase
VSVVVFPQGARAAGFDLTRFNSIGVKLAQRAGVPIAPCALVTDAWGLGSRIPDLGRIDPTKKVHIAFGEPMRVDGRGADQHRAVIEFIDEKLRTWQTVEGSTAPSIEVRDGSRGARLAK